MGVMPMQRVELCGLKKERKQILEALQRFGAIEVTAANCEDDLFKKSDVSSAKIVLDKGFVAARKALEILDRFASESKSIFSSLEGRKETTAEFYRQFDEKRDEILEDAYQIISYNKDVLALEAEVPKMETQMDTLDAWINFDLPLNFRGTHNTRAFIGTLPVQTSKEDLEFKFTSEQPKLEAISIDIISKTKDQTCLFVLCHKKNAEMVEQVLRGLGFARPALTSSTVPAEKKIQLEKELNENKQKTEKTEELIRAYQDKIETLRFMVDYYAMRLEKYEVISNIMQTNRVFVLTGYIPKMKAASLESLMNQNFSVAMEFKEPSVDEDVPVLLHNNAFSAPVESIVESYSLPGKGEVDPTGVMSLFYYFLFGLMLSDAAYGILLSGLCGFALQKFKNMEKGMRNSLTMFFYCGISTIFWGILFGSYFGDVADVASKTFFGTHFTIAPVWFAPINQPMRMLVFCFVIGIIHLFAGLAMQFYQLLRAKKYKDILYDVLFWYALIISLIFLLLSSKMFTEILGLNFILPGVVGSISTIVAVAAAIGIILTGGRESRSPFKRILKGLYSLYNITGYLSDVLSYSRLLALGLATGVIASVINQMGSMPGKTPAGVIVFILVFIIGHTMNIAINTLGAYVHTNRLQYVEFFGKFYSGGGRKFNPFSVHTQYYKFKEEKNNE